MLASGKLSSDASTKQPSACRSICCHGPLCVVCASGFTAVRDNEGKSFQSWWDLSCWRIINARSHIAGRGSSTDCVPSLLSVRAKMFAPPCCIDVRARVSVTGTNHVSVLAPTTMDGFPFSQGMVHRSSASSIQFLARAGECCHEIRPGRVEIGIAYALRAPSFIRCSDGKSGLSMPLPLIFDTALSRIVRSP